MELGAPRQVGHSSSTPARLVIGGWYLGRCRVLDEGRQRRERGDRGDARRLCMCVEPAASSTRACTADRLYVRFQKGSLMEYSRRQLQLLVFRPADMDFGACCRIP